VASGYTELQQLGEQVRNEAFAFLLERLDTRDVVLQPQKIRSLCWRVSMD
jgi:hypothetical protein